jgi:hypothetical protein
MPARRTRQQPADEPTGPRADHLRLPAEYGVPKGKKALLPWSHVTERMTSALHYWVCTVSPTSQPHATPSMACGWTTGCTLAAARRPAATTT